MPEQNLLSQHHVIRSVTNANKREFVLFLGAGASKSSGMPLASEMIHEWRQIAFNESSNAGANFDEWCGQQSWYGKEDEYSLLFEKLFKSERERQLYVEPKVEASFPSWCYLYLANIVQAGYFNVIFTTNFDDLVNEALTMYLDYNPVVCSADSEVTSISLTTDRAKIIKLHGDYLFKSLKNTVENLEKLLPQMRKKLREFGRQCGMVVIGYAGRDNSIMSVLEELLKDKNSFPNGIYWGLRPNEKPATRVEGLATQYPNRFQLFECQDFDMFMSQMHATLHRNDKIKLDLPPAVLKPYESLRDKLERLVKKTTASQQNDETIKEHIRNLEEELNRPWAKVTDVAEFDLLQAQLALGKRDYQTALKYVSKYSQQRPNDANALTTWGTALAIQSEEESSEAAFQEAAAKWMEAVQLDPQALLPRYNLARFYWQKQKFKEAIPVFQDLLKLVPNDRGMRRNFVMLLNSNGRYEEALREVDWLLTQEPDAADLYAMKASVLEQRGLLDEALEELKKAVKLNPQNALYHLILASSFVRLGQGDRAVSELEEAIKLDPRNLSYRIQMTSLCCAINQLPRALEQMLEAAKIEPNSAEVQGWLGQLYLTFGNLGQARMAIEEALRLSPNDSRLLGNAGILYYLLNRPDLAEQKLQAAAQLNPSMPQPRHLLCMLYWMQNRSIEFNESLKYLAPIHAQQLLKQLQMLTQQFGQNRHAALQATWPASWQQNQQQTGPQQQQQPPWPHAPQAN